MQLYRSNLNNGGSGEDYSATYTATVNGELQMGSIGAKYLGNTTFNSPVIVGENVRMFAYAFQGCTNFGSDIYIKGKNARDINIQHMLLMTNNSKRKNIHFNSVFDSVFYNNGDGGKLASFGTMAWSTMTNGYYNAAYNIYCFNNYGG